MEGVVLKTNELMKMSYLRWLVAAFAVAASVLVLSAVPALGQEDNLLRVDDDGEQCTNAEFQTIQEAVDAAGPGDEIQVCEGTYEEQVTIGEDKDDLTLTSRRPRIATIKAPETMEEPGDLVTVDGAEGVTISDFIISGPLPNNLFCSGELRSGVRIIGGASATISGNRITEIRSESEDSRGCQNGLAIAVGRGSQNQTGTATITNNDIDMYQKGGIYADGDGTEVSVRNNDIRGIGPTDVIAQNGIQVSRGATGSLVRNLVRDNTYTGMPTDDPNDDDGFQDGAEPGQASGLILFQLGGDLNVTNNNVRVNDTNIALYDADRLSVSGNQARNATFYDGIYADADSTGNRFNGNTALGNDEEDGFDCNDDSEGNRTAGTANIWKNNTDATDDPNGLCRAPRR